MSIIRKLSLRKTRSAEKQPSTAALGDPTTSKLSRSSSLRVGPASSMGTLLEEDSFDDADALTARGASGKKITVTVAYIQGVSKKTSTFF